MASYSVLIKKSAERELRAISQPELGRLVARIQGLATRLRPPGCEKLSREDRYRIRQGDYHVVYGIDDNRRTVQVVKIGHRREVYREANRSAWR
jgi:mRNA interferase RelE/StbE